MEKRGEFDEFVNDMERSSAEGVIELSETDCCALESAFENNPKATKDLMEMLDFDEGFNEYRKGLRAGTATEIPNEGGALMTSLKMVSGQIAKIELERINNESEHVENPKDLEEEGEKELECGHILGEHMLSLQRLVEAIEPKAIH